MAVNISVLNSTTGFGGLCLKFTRLALGAPALYATAYKAWLGAQHKHPGDANPPYGVPVFWAPHDPGGAGHVAPSLGGGLVRTTNSATQTIYTVAISKITAAWGMPYLGWAEDLNGVRVWTPPAPTPTPTPTPVTPPHVQEEDMLPLILWCYAELVGRAAPPSTDEVANWISGTPGWTSAQVLAAFLAARAERGSVVAAYQDFLGREPESQAVIDAHLAAKPTIGQVRINLANSPEAHR